ncbi:MAG: hypothetical protein LBD82_04905, partial [Deltaproteobacteria bacterium]|nr:hypothetical protein [Deltaproteobacteria bacterium]
QLTNQSFNTLLLTPLIERGRNADRPPSGTQGNLLTRWNIMNERGRAEATRTSPEALYLLASSVFTNPNVHDRDTHYSVERLDGTDRYLVSCTASFAAPRNERGGPGPRQTEVTYDPHGNTRPMPVLERLTYEITLEVTLGERPAVNSANLDIMLHGWQDAPPALL